jgi:serine/threonine protein kinase
MPCAYLTIAFPRYVILDILGQGTFGQVVKCQNVKTHEVVAVKVVKNKPAYFNQSMMEVTILEMVLSFSAFLLFQLWSDCDFQLAQQESRSHRRTPHLATPRLIHTPQPPVSRLRAAVLQSLRADQAESIPRTQHSARQSLHGPITRRFNCAEGSAAHPL